MTNAERQKRWRELHPEKAKKLKKKWLEKKGLTWAAYKRDWRMKHPEEFKKRIHTLAYYVKLTGIDVDNLKEKYPELQKLLNTPYKELKGRYGFPLGYIKLALRDLGYNVSSWIERLRVLHCLDILNYEIKKLTGILEKNLRRKKESEGQEEWKKKMIKYVERLKNGPMLKAMIEGKFYPANTAKTKPNTKNLMRVRLSDPISNHKGEKICPFCNTSFRTWRRFDAHLLWHKIGKEDNIGFWQDGDAVHFLKLKKHKKDLTTPKEIIKNLENEYNKNLSDLKNSIDSFLN